MVSQVSNFDTNYASPRAVDPNATTQATDAQATTTPTMPEGDSFSSTPTPPPAEKKKANWLAWTALSTLWVPATIVALKFGFKKDI